jgi:anti-sigma B factor antagonist
MPGHFSIRAHQMGACHTLVLTGELDISTAPALETVISDLCAHGATEVVLDLSQLEFADSRGLRAILMARSTCEEFLCDFSVTPGSRQVQRVFEISGLLNLLPFRTAEKPPPADSVQLWPDPTTG